MAQVVLATGSCWRKDGYGRPHQRPVAGSDAAHVYTPDHILDGLTVEGPVLIYDDDHYYMGGVLAEKLRTEGRDVILMTTEAMVCAWTVYTLEQHLIQKRLLEMDVKIITNHRLAGIDTHSVRVARVYTDRETEIEAASVIMLTSRLPNDDLYQSLLTGQSGWAGAGIKTVKRIGDCHAPATIAAAVYEGHRYARELGQTPINELGFRRELTELSANF